MSTGASCKTSYPLTFSTNKKKDVVHCFDLLCTECGILLGGPLTWFREISEPVQLTYLIFIDSDRILLFCEIFIGSNRNTPERKSTKQT